MLIDRAEPLQDRLRLRDHCVEGPPYGLRDRAKALRDSRIQQ